MWHFKRSVTHDRISGGSLEKDTSDVCWAFLHICRRALSHTCCCTGLSRERGSGVQCCFPGCAVTGWAGAQQNACCIAVALLFFLSPSVSALFNEARSVLLSSTSVQLNCSADCRIFFLNCWRPLWTGNTWTGSLAMPSGNWALVKALRLFKFYFVYWSLRNIIWMHAVKENIGHLCVSCVNWSCLVTGNRWELGLLNPCTVGTRGSPFSQVPAGAGPDVDK